MFFNKQFTYSIVSMLMAVLLSSSSFALSPAEKKINVIVIYLSPDSAQATKIEDMVGHIRISPFLKKRGYDVENVFSIHRLAANNGGLDRALLTAFADMPQKDEARLLIVTLGAEPGISPNSIRTNLAVIDAHTSGIIAARRTRQLSARLEKLWTFEDEPVESSVAKVGDTFNERLDLALIKFDNQFMNKVTY